MTDYEVRMSLFHKQVSYCLADDALVTLGGAPLALNDIKRVQVYCLRGRIGIAGKAISRNAQLCKIWPAHGWPIIIPSKHFLGIGRFEDRSEKFRPFIGALIEKISAINPGAIFIVGMPLAVWCLWAFVLVSAALVVPAMLGFFLVAMLGNNTMATVAVSAIVLLVFLLLLFYFLPPLGAEWPRRFNPRKSLPPASKPNV